MALSIYPSASVVMVEPQDEMDAPLLKNDHHVVTSRPVRGASRAS
jgi:hypothetical protein